MVRKLWALRRALQQPKVRWAAVIIWMGLIFFVSGQSSVPFMPDHADLRDIAGHFTAYAVLALLWRWALAGAGVRQAGLWAFAAAALYGLSDELHQSFVPGRHPDPFDILTDIAGAAAALIAWNKMNRRTLDRPLSRPG